jgi:MSHA pilin protein MshD
MAMFYQASLEVRCERRVAPRAPHANGIALIETIVFIVVLATAAGATLSVFANSNRRSAELLAERQAMAIGEAMLNEVLAAPFTACDPQDANFAGPGPCASMPEVLPGGPEPGETRLSFDNVNDYNGFTMGPGIVPREGVINGLDAYSLSISVAPIVPPGSTWNGIDGSNVALVTVTVTNVMPYFSPVIVQGIRTRFAPRSLPLP